MSDTPRTDAITKTEVWPEEYGPLCRDLARTLERELAAVTAERDQLRTILRAVKFCADSTIVR